MRKPSKGDSLECLVSDLILKLGKANGQIHALSQRVYELERRSYREPEHYPSTNRYNLLEKH